MKNCEAISKYISVNYNHSVNEKSMVFKKMETPTIDIPEVPEDTSSRVDILIWEKKYKGSNRKYITFKKNNKKTYSLIPQHCTP